MSTIPLDLVKRDRSPAAFVVYIYLSSKAGARSVRASLHSIAGDTGISKSGVQAALRLLNKRKLIRTEKATPTSTPVHHIVRR